MGPRSGGVHIMEVQAYAVCSKGCVKLVNNGPLGPASYVQMDLDQTFCSATAGFV